jgi:phage pi2 protein 07
MEPIPFGGWIDVDSQTKSKEQVEKILKDMLGNDPQSDIKYVILADGSVYFFRKEGDRYAICEQTPPLQEGI